MRRSLFAGIGVAAVLVLAACSDRAQERAPLTPTGPSLAQSPLCSNGLASDIVKQQKALYVGAALTDVTAKFDLVKAACPGVAGDDELMNYLEATITHRPDTVKTITKARAEGIVALWKSVASYYAPPADSLVRPFTVLMDSGGAEVLSPGESMTTFDQGAKLKLDGSSTPGGQHLFTFERKPTSACDGTTSLNVTRNGASLQTGGTGCYDVKDYPHETSYTPAALISLCLKQLGATAEEIGLVHQRTGFGGELLPVPTVLLSHSCLDFHASSGSWLRTNGGPFGRAFASLYDYVRPRPLFADDVGESGVLGLFSLVGGTLTEVFEDGFTANPVGAFPNQTNPVIGDTASSWFVSVQHPGSISIANGFGGLTGNVIVLSQALGNCDSCPQLHLLGTRVNPSATDTAGIYDVTWSSVQTKPSVKSAPFVVRTFAGADIATLAYASEGPNDIFKYNGATVLLNGSPLTWSENAPQDFRITVKLLTVNGQNAYRTSLAVKVGAAYQEVVSNVKWLNLPDDVSLAPTVAKTFSTIGYVLSGIDAGVIGADDFRIIRRSDVP